MNVSIEKGKRPGAFFLAVGGMNFIKESNDGSILAIELFFTFSTISATTTIMSSSFLTARIAVSR